MKIKAFLKEPKYSPENKKPRLLHDWNNLFELNFVVVLFIYRNKRFFNVTLYSLIFSCALYI